MTEMKMRNKKQKAEKRGCETIDLTAANVKSVNDRIATVMNPRLMLFLNSSYLMSEVISMWLIMGAGWLE